MNFETMIKEYLSSNPGASIDDAGKMLSHALNAVKEEQENKAKETEAKAKMDSLVAAARNNLIDAAKCKYSANDVNLISKILTPNFLMDTIDAAITVAKVLPDSWIDKLLNSSSDTFSASNAKFNTELCKKLTDVPNIKVRVGNSDVEENVDKIIDDFISKLI